MNENSRPTLYELAAALEQIAVLPRGEQIIVGQKAAYLLRLLDRRSSAQRDQIAYDAREATDGLLNTLHTYKDAP